MDRTYLTSDNIIVDADKQTFPALFTHTVDQFPSNIALSFDDTEYTYRDINVTVNQLAAFLLTKKVKPEDRIAIALDRTPQMVITLLAVLKAGAAYIPLDPEYPKDRIEYMLSDSGARFLITSKKYTGQFNTEATQLFTDDIWPLLASQPADEPNVNITGDQLAYILYTSGSTGRPKGVPIEHQSLANLLLSVQKQPGIASTDVLLSVTTISFDIAALELFLPLITGAKLIITDAATAKDSRLLLKLIQTHQVSIMQATPNTWRMMLESGWDEKLPLKVLCGGEALPLALAQKLVAKCDSLWNMYGPTETTIWSTLKQISASDSVITIGKPIDETVIYILNENNQQVLIGEQGEICIGGKGLARGYLNRPELTADKFITFSNGAETIRLYKTGDLGKILLNNDIQCFGRIDHQVKISGFRIELGEIENVIQQSGLVSETVILTKEDEDGNKNLVGYAIPALDKVKLKEKELYKQQVDSWEKVYDTEYEQSGSQLKTDNDGISFDTNVWTDSFTIKTIPVEEMHEWLNDIINVVLAEKPQDLLEIGCGTGLIFYQLAPHIKKYIGTDLSASGINALKHQINKKKEQYPETSLLVCPAHEIELAPAEKIDTILINSVIQYFPGEDYLTEVLAKSISLLNGCGKIIVSDVRNLQLLGLFKTYLTLSRLPADVDIKEFEYLVDQEMLKEEELCVSPEYFYHLRSLFPQITHVDIQWKQGQYINELIAYRYTVIIYVGIDKPVFAPAWQQWQPGNDAAIEQAIQNKQAVIALSDVPNPRLAKESLLQKGLDDTAIYTTGDLSAFIAGDNTIYQQAAGLIRHAQAQGYNCKYLLNTDPLKLNLLLQLQPADAFITPLYNAGNAGRSAFTNIPLLATICTLIQRDIYQVMLERLPAYMIPANLTIVTQLPLTNNGKIDRQFLMQRNSNLRNQPVNYKAAGTDIEKTLVNIWQELLGIERIGINDNFFELGGNSLIAIRIMITLEKTTGQDMPLSSLFEYPTIGQLAAIIQNTSREPTGSKCLVRLKPGGSKIPLYIVHGWGLTVFIFKDLAESLHPDQPVFALQGIGVDGFEEPLTNVEDIAARYITEILEQNPTGPYAFAGYSLGGVIACEIVKQLRNMGKEVVMLAMFDAYAHTTETNTINNIFSFKKLSKLFLRIGHNVFDLIRDPDTWNEKMIQINRKMPKWLKKNKIGKLRKDNDVDFYSNDLSKVYFSATVQNYKLNINEETIELFRATKNIYYYMDDPIYLGWQQYAKTVNMHKVKGSHTTMFLSPNYQKFADILQQCLDNASNPKQ
ncbi:amino acid adenylation domain-containing protein [Mucilaginibacter sp. AW1-3]